MVNTGLIIETLNARVPSEITVTDRPDPAARVSDDPIAIARNMDAVRGTCRAMRSGRSVMISKEEYDALVVLGATPVTSAEFQKAQADWHSQKAGRRPQG